MPIRKLTAAGVERLRPPPSGRVEYFDELLSGFALRVTDKGHKSWCVFYRLGGRQRRMTLGSYPAMELKEAREEARAALRAVERGEDPIAARKARRAAHADTYEAAVDAFIEKYAKKRQKTWKETERVLKRHCASWLKRSMVSITKRDAYELLDGFVAAGHEAKARVTLSWLRTLWRWAWERDMVEAPIMDAVRVEVQRTVRQRHYTDDEVKAVWAACEEFAPLEGGFVKLLMLLGVRKGELAGMRWDELDDPREPTLWTVPHARTKTKKTAARERVYIVPLPSLAARVLRGMPWADDELVFPGRRKSEPDEDGRQHALPLHPGTAMKVRVREKSGVSDWTYHPCRDTIATWLQDQGHSEFERGLVLNHAGAATVTADYSHGYAEDLKRELLGKWARHVEALVTPKGATDVLR